MGRKLQPVEVVTDAEAARRELPESVQAALGELVGAAQEGLLALSVGVGLGVLSELMEEEVVDVVGPRSKPDTARVAYRHGREPGEVVLGGRVVAVERPRVRAKDGSSEVELQTYRHFADRDPLDRVVLERMLAGVSCRRYPRTQEPVGEQVELKARSVSRSALSRRFSERTRRSLGELMSRRLDEVALAVVMLDGIELKGRTNLVALGICADDRKLPLGLWEGSTENATVASALLSDLVERGLDASGGVLVCIDGAKALRKAVRDVFGASTPVQRCIRHKERNVESHLPERERPWVRRKLRSAWAEPEYGRALASLEVLARQLETSHPGAAASLREGLSETLTLTRLGVSGPLKAVLASTNPVESMIEIVRTTQRNVKRWRSGEMALRWTAAGMLEAERQFRRVVGYRDLPKLVAAIERELRPNEEAPMIEAA